MASGASLASGDGDFIGGSKLKKLWDRIGYQPGNTPNRYVASGFDALPNGGKSDRAQLAPIDRINQAYEAMQQQTASNLVPANSPGVFGPDAVMTGGPGAPYGVANIPDKVRPAPADDQQSPIGFFLRNALAQRDQESGNYLNPTVGAQAMSSPFKGLFG